MVELSLSGSMPPAASQYLIHKSWVPPGKVIATLTSLPAAFLAANAALRGDASVLTLRSLYSLATETAWASRLRRARRYIGVGTLFCVTFPVEMRYGIGVR